MILAAGLAAIAVAILIALIGFALGPTAFDRAAGGQFDWHHDHPRHCTAWICHGPPRISGYFGSLRDPQLYRHFCRAEAVQHRHIGKNGNADEGIMTEVLYYVAMAFISIGGIALIIGAIRSCAAA